MFSSFALWGLVDSNASSLEKNGGPRPMHSALFPLMTSTAMVIDKESQNMCIPQASQEGNKISKKTTDCSSDDDAPIASLQRPQRRRG
jgi:hypothetical protein